MKIQTTLATAAAVLGMAVGSAALAADTPGMEKSGEARQGATPSFEEIDTNLDGSVSRSEALAVPELDFAKADVDQNGVLSRAEYDEALS